MKKMLDIAVAAAVGFCLLPACGSAGDAAQPYRAGSAAVQITTQVFEKEYRSADHQALLGQCSYSLPYLSVADDASSGDVVEIFNDNSDSMLEDEVESWEQAMEDAQNDYDHAAGSEEWLYGGHWTNAITYEAHQTDTLISIRYTHSIYTGGAHGYTYYTGQLFALKEGYFLTVDEMTDDPAGLRQAVADEILRQIDEGDLAVQFAYWNDYASYVTEWMDGDHSIFFNEAGEMEVLFPAYELASYAAGPQQFAIAQDVFAPYLNDYGKVLLDIA